MQEVESSFGFYKNYMISTDETNEKAVKKGLLNLFEAINNGVDNLAAVSKKEKDNVNKRIANFNGKDSNFMKLIKKNNWTKINNEELRQIAAILSYKTGIPLHRGEKRRKSEIIMWYEENYESIKNELESMELSIEEFDITQS